MKQFQILLSSVFAISLVACGGGGGGSSTTPNTDYISKYVGTWKTACWQTSIYKDTTNGNAASYVTRTHVITKTSNTVGSISGTDTIYSSTDTTCSGAVAATVIRNGENTGAYNSSATTKTITSSLGVNTVTYAGAASISGASTAENFDASYHALYSTAGTTLTIGTVQLNSNDFLAQTGKSAAYVNGSTLTYGQGGGTTYPTALQTTASGIFTKQP